MAQWLWTGGSFLNLLVVTIVAQKVIPHDPFVNLMAADTKCRVSEKIPCGVRAIGPDNWRDVGVVQKASNHNIMVSSQEVILTSGLPKPVMMQSAEKVSQHLDWVMLSVMVSVAIAVAALMLSIILWSCCQQEQCGSSQ
ncbi:zona pellucida sperm-binding protein 4-like [Arapaima gigas]